LLPVFSRISCEDFWPVFGYFFRRSFSANIGFMLSIFLLFFSFFGTCGIPVELRPQLRIFGVKMARLQKEDKAPRRTAGLRLQLTPTERATLDRRAAAAGLHLSEWGRRMLLSDLRAPAPAARDPAAIRGLRAEVCHVSNNLNQMTRHANTEQHLPAQEALAAMLAEVAAVLRKVREL
jgi:mobilization protein NikA